jgi:hypothetical protein
MSSERDLKYPFKLRIGSKRQVYNGSAVRTAGGLTRKDLLKNKHGRIVSRRRHMLGRSRGLAVLKKHGLVLRKGQVPNAFKKSRRSRSRSTRRKHRGGFLNATSSSSAAPAAAAATK